MKNNNRNRIIYTFFLVVVLVLVSIIYASLAINIGVKINKEKALTPEKDIVPNPGTGEKTDDTPYVPSNRRTPTPTPTPDPEPTPTPEPDVPVIIPDDMNWRIIFDNIIVKSGSVRAITDAHILSSKTEIGYEIVLKEPGEYYNFSVDIRNEGNIDAKVYESIKSGINEVQSKYLIYEVTYDDGTPVKVDDVLKKESSRKINVLVKFKDEVNQNDLPKQNQYLDLIYKVTFIEK